MVFSITNTFVNGTIANAGSVNDNFTDVVDEFNRYLTVAEQTTLLVGPTSGSISYIGSRISHLIQNIGSTICYVNFDAAATSGCWKIQPTETYSLQGYASALFAVTVAGSTTIRAIGQV
jgi:hypothetical protein